MKTLTDNLARLMPPPPLWLMLATTVVLSAALLMAFIDILREHVRHGEEERRQWQRVGLVRQPIGTVAAAAQQAKPPQLATSFSQQLQR